MDLQLFLRRLEESLSAAPNAIRETDDLQKLEAWDSIGALSVIAMIDGKYGVVLGIGKLTECGNVRDLAAMVASGAGVELASKAA